MAGPKQRLGFAYRFVVFIVRPILMVLTRRDWHGAEHLPPAGKGVVVVANHVSHVDPLTFGHFLWDNGRAPRYLAKEGVFRIPIIGRIIAACGQIPVYRESRDAARAFRDAVAAVKAGECVGIYPEGTITRDPGLWPMVGKTGAARVALETGCPVIPIAQWGVQDLLAPYSKRPRPFPLKTIHVHAGPPIDLSDLSDQPLTAPTLRAATERIMTAITTELAGIRGELPPAKRFDPRADGLPPIGNPKKHVDRPDESAP
ncbi:MAG TPA: lysophospholipid acyltransferase family protein [Jiangellaceae bacterium]|nr:lysophospholipid acyltransferase family protein [Jiangellaceae bacterium]